jgi:multiple antibiotic resistance protein
MVGKETPNRQRFILMREMSFALIAMLIFNFLGEYLLNWLSLTSVTIKIASGIILFLTAIKIIFPGETDLRLNLPEGEPYLFPLAIPLIAGPSLLATIMLYAVSEPSIIDMLGAIFIAWLICALILLLSPQLTRILGKNGLMASEKLTGTILVLLSLQRFLEGVKEFLHSYCDL